MILYVDCSAGISGDMLLAAFLDLGFPRRELIRSLRPLGLERSKIQMDRVRRDGVEALRVTVSGKPYSFPRISGDLIRRLRRSDLSPWMKRSLVRVWTVLSRAEGIAHHRFWRKTRFHQLSGTDAWVELAGLCAALKHFEIKAMYTSTVPLGCRHRDPHERWQARPGPATVHLLRRFPVRRLPYEFEWTTPTGAAFLEAFASPQPAPPFEVLRVGHGVGHGRPPVGPSVLRLLLGETFK